MISADTHVAENADLWARLPRRLRHLLPKVEASEDGRSRTLSVPGSTIVWSETEAKSEDDLDREFRRDPSGGTDLRRRLADMDRDGVHAQVVFPNLGLTANATVAPELNVALAAAYNDWVFDVFAADRARFRPAAILQVDDLGAALAEAERSVKKGFATLFLPVSVPWRPYFHPDYEPLWAFAAEARIPLNFHVFSGNLWFGSDFAYLHHIPRETFEVGLQVAKSLGDTPERLSTTVIGMAAGMGPIVHLTGSGVLERHPGLRFVVSEAECGWLAWTLTTMDAMQEKRHLTLTALPRRASEYFLAQGAVTITDDVVGLHNLPLTGTKCLLWANDYPHDEGSFPSSAAAIAAVETSAGAAGARAILADNAARLYDFDLDVLGALAASVPPSPA